MTCLEFRRRKLADPRRVPPEIEAHAHACARCAVFGQGVDAGEAQLAAALAVPVPDGLAERILLRQRSGRRMLPLLLALAATLVLSAGIGAFWWQFTPRHDYAAYAIRHVVDDPHPLADAEVEPQRVKAVLANFGGKLSGDMHDALGTVRFLGNCPTPEGKGWHFIIDTPHGPATIILIPGDRHGLRTQHASAEGLNALARRAGQGYYALVSNSPQALEDLDARVQRGLRWTS